MKYVLMIYSGDKAWQAYESLSEEEQRSVLGEYMAISQEPGAVGGEQLQPVETATTVRVEDGRTLTTDGPFAETKEALGGFYLFEADDLDLLQGMADQAAIALTNSNLLARLTREEARFRGLVQTTPDVLWRADADGMFTFMADTGESLFGWPIDEIVGKHFAHLTDAETLPIAEERWALVAANPDLVERVPLTLVRRDGSTFQAEVTLTGVVEQGRFAGGQGTVRDVSERQRLEDELRRSEERYR